jgi:hypothetical protein
MLPLRGDNPAGILIVIHNQDLFYIIQAYYRFWSKVVIPAQSTG